ncbi:phosphatidylinositol 3-kinase catalytic subunit type 3 [Nematostella vectensis]|uniref:phosphatidylinositol 3-kinase catalytic subunit type 3 n=1 Tax=Nematostella vectensis TaxID=45351 RepID=UPI00138FFA7E|nr:phosphatidylinositol 3-kinase catalytic subunit type 3 [Nematostella vectensis]
MNSTTAQDKFHYVYSSDVDDNLEIKICTLEGKRDRQGHKELLDDPLLRYSGLYQSECSDLYVTCTIYADDRPLSLPTGTSYRPFSTRWNWNEWLKLPIKYPDLPRNAQLAFTIWDVYGPRKSTPVGGTTVSLFGKYGTLRHGMHDLKVWPGVEADGKMPTSTPGKTTATEDQMNRLAKLSKKHHKGQMLKVDWLDRLTFREIEMINEKEKRNSNFMYLMVKFPRVHYDGQDYNIVYFEKDADEVDYVCTNPEIVKLPEPEILLDNLVEIKHHKLVRSIRSGTVSRDLKPNANTRDHLNQIVSYPPTKVLTSEEKDLVWQFRFYLTNQKKALTKFMKCVDWNEPQEAKQAIELLSRWTPMDVEDALELLSSGFSNKSVRQYAVSRLKEANDEDLLLYLLQLVQALRYEPVQEEEKSTEDLQEPPQEEPTYSRDPLSQDEAGDNEPSPVIKTITEQELDEEADLASFLITRACKSDTVANYFYWYLLVECKEDKDSKVANMYRNIMRKFSKALMKGSWECKVRRNMLGKQQQFIDHIVRLMKEVSQFSGNRSRKIHRLRELLDTPELTRFGPLPLPLDPDVRIMEVVVGTQEEKKAWLFKSHLMPAKLTFRDINEQEYVVIFKNGDDLRQDQLILQMIRLMDKLLMKENLDLKLTPYKVLATSASHGLVQFIESNAVAEVLDKDGSIQNYFRKHAPCETGPNGISPEVMDTYVKSCAGYCVITYLLGVGDRHLDNLLLTKSGNLFHIDFGYILGRDPKPLPPPMKLSKEMVEGMGGANGECYQAFRKQCYTAFLHLRRHANLILNLFGLMVDASVPDIALEPDKTVKKVQDKFRLDLSDEEAVQYLQSLIDESVSAMFAVVVEQIHKFAQYWRK